MWWAQLLNNTVGVIGSPSAATVPVAGYSVWLDASDASTFTYSSGSVVSQWSDKSGNSNNATMATVSAQPSRVTSVLNGLPVVRFDGTTDVMNLPGSTLSNETNFSMFWVIVPRGLSSGYYPSVSGINGTNDVGAFHYINSSAKGAAYPFHSINNVPTGWGVYDGTSSLTYSVGTGYEMEFHANGSTFTVIRGGTTEGSGAVAAPYPLSTVTIASQGLQNRFSQFDYGEILIYPTVLSGTDQALVRTYLQTKWGV